MTRNVITVTGCLCLLLQNAPHPQYVVTADKWEYPYSRGKAAYPAVRHTHAGTAWNACGSVHDIAAALPPAALGHTHVKILANQWTS